MPSPPQSASSWKSNHSGEEDEMRCCFRRSRSAFPQPIPRATRFSDAKLVVVVVVVKPSSMQVSSPFAHTGWPRCYATTIAAVLVVVCVIDYYLHVRVGCAPGRFFLLFPPSKSRAREQSDERCAARSAAAVQWQGACKFSAPPPLSLLIPRTVSLSLGCRQSPSEVAVRQMC